MLVSDHGLVLDRSAPSHRPVEGTGPARWRTGTPRDGEVELTGPRVLRGDGRVVVPWREDIRYVARKAGYHGGAALAEMTVPVLVFLAEAADTLPMGWSVLTPETTRPAWWSARAPAADPAPAPVARPVRKRAAKASTPDDGHGLFEMPASAPPVMATLGRRVIDSPVFGEQRRFVRRAPEPDAVAALIDALVRENGELTATAALAVLGRAGRPPGPVLAAVQRLLNVEGYPVLSSDGRTVRLDGDTLRLQFGVSDP